MMEGQRGNVSDKKSLHEGVVRMKEYEKEIKKAPNFIYVCDSEIYSNIVKYGENMKWIFRVPETIGNAKNIQNMIVQSGS